MGLSGFSCPSLMKGKVGVAVLLLATKVAADTVLLVGGEVDNYLHPAIANVEAVGPCGVFSSGVPDLPKARRDGAAAVWGNELVVCGGHAFLSAIKTCSALTLGTWPLQWRDFPSMMHARDNFGLVVVGGDLYAVGGSVAIGSQHSIERYNGSAWEEVGQTLGFREDFCTVAWGDDEILVIGGYDDIGRQTRTEVFNVTSGSWRQLAVLNVGRGMHACAKYNGGVMIAGGWTNNNDPDFPGQEVTRTTEWYDPAENIWVEMGILRNRRTKFALDVVNGTLTAMGGWEGYYTESVEVLGPDGAWDWADYSLTQQKAGFGVAHVNEMLEDENCFKK